MSGSSPGLSVGRNRGEKKRERGGGGEERVRAVRVGRQEGSEGREEEV